MNFTSSWSIAKVHSGATFLYKILNKRNKKKRNDLPLHNNCITEVICAYYFKRLICGVIMVLFLSCFIFVLFCNTYVRYSQSTSHCCSISFVISSENCGVTVKRNPQSEPVFTYYYNYLSFFTLLVFFSSRYLRSRRRRTR